MASTGLSGPYSLTGKEIDLIITKTSPGTYALGKLKSDGGFVVKYVGRSDKCLNTRLKNWVGDYTHFKANYYPTEKAAFEKECRVFHDFGGIRDLDNKIHPDRAKNTDWECPVCTIFD